ncbi:MAG: hydantoinase/oxoprolinase family protein [Betaproteobacteria bacterium]
MKYSAGVDIGGTFTDVVLMDARGGIVAEHKVDTTPAALEACFVNALGRATEKLAPEDVHRILHATTVATNSVLEGKGARTALIVTEGFRDILEIARQRRPSLYDLKAEKAKPLVPRRLCIEVRERVGADGAVVTPLDDSELEKLASAVEATRADSVVIALLFSYLNASHEQKLREHLATRFPHKLVVASSDVIPEFREFERTSTAVLVGYLKPIFARYTENLAAELQKRGHQAKKLLIMNSAGGVMSPDAARDRPHAIVESGPAAGVIAAATLADQLGEKNVISFDMGGTTAKASLIENGAYRTTTEYEIGGGVHQSLAVRFTGFPIKAPMIDLTECSAGGGSIASVDDVGVLKVGPRSAGADPGPACYGRGGTEPTVTDANVVLGRINPDYFIGGEARLDRELAHAAIESRIARPLGMTVMEAAAGIIDIVNAHMARILRVVSVARGLDPRDFSLIAFGGAGPLHAADLAADLGIPRVVVPEAPGVFSALGLLWADLRADFSGTVRRNVAREHAAAIQAALERVEGEAQAWLEREKVPAARRSLVRSAEMRYPLQNYEINVPLPAGKVDAAWIARACQAFHVAHERLYSYCDREEAVQLVNLRVAAVGRTDRPKPRLLERGSASAQAALKERRKVHFQASGRFVDAPVYERDRLRSGNRIAGPAVIEQADATILVPPSFNAVVDPHGRIAMTHRVCVRKAEWAKA